MAYGLKWTINSEKNQIVERFGFESDHMKQIDLTEIS